MDLDALIQSFGDDEPSGADLEYDPVFTDLEIAATYIPERQDNSGKIVPAEDPDFKDVAEKAQDILGRSHDLRAGVYMAEAQIRLKGFPGFAEATTYLARCVEEHWDTCHPQLDEDDDDDPTMRVNAILRLNDPVRILNAVRRAPLTASKVFGALSLRDITVAEGEMTPPADMETVPDSGQVAAAFQDTMESKAEEMDEIVAAAAQALEDVQKISTVFDAKIGSNPTVTKPNLDPLIKILKQVNAKLASALGRPVGDAAVAEDAAAAPGGAVAGGAAAASAGASGGGAINSPTDVQNALDRIIGYYQREEPSSPLPILLERAKKLVGADFLTIVRNMAPDGVDQVNLLGGLEDDDD